VTCREARELADAFLSDQLLVETTNEIVRHLETCPACRAEFDARRRLRTRLRSAVDAAPALAPTPEFVAALKAKLHPAETPADVTRREWLKSWMAAAAAVVAVVGGGLFARDELRRRRFATLAALAAGDHQNCALKFNLAEQPIPLEEAARRFDPAYATLASLALPASAASLARHSCVFDGRRFGHVVFRYQDHVVSLLVTAGEGDGSAVPATVSVDGPLRVAAFDVGAHAVFVVSDLPERDTLAVAKELAVPVRQALALA
jgi:anti-sigma factor RsiW